MFPFHIFPRRFLPLLAATLWSCAISPLQSEPLQRTEQTVNAPQNPWSGALKAQIGYDSNIFEANRHTEQIAGSWFSENALELSHSLPGESPYELTLQAEYKTYFSTNTLDEYLFQPGVSWQGLCPGNISLDLHFAVAGFRARVTQDLVDEPDETEEAFGAETGFQFEKTFPDQTTLRWGGLVEGAVFEYLDGSNITCSTTMEAKRPLGNEMRVAAGITSEWQIFRHMTWSGQPTDEPPELNTIYCRAFTGLSGSWSNALKWEIMLQGGPVFDIDTGYYNAMVIGLRPRISYRFDKWTLAVKLDPEIAFFSRRPSLLGESSPDLSVQKLWARTEVVYALRPGWDIFASASFGYQRTNGGDAVNASLTSFDAFVIRSGLVVEF
jgi:hypothetical protein